MGISIVVGCFLGANCYVFDKFKKARLFFDSPLEYGFCLNHVFQSGDDPTEGKKRLCEPIGFKNKEPKLVSKLKKTRNKLNTFYNLGFLVDNTTEKSTRRK